MFLAVETSLEGGLGAHEENKPKRLCTCNIMVQDEGYQADETVMWLSRENT